MRTRLRAWRHAALIALCCVACAQSSNDRARNPWPAAGATGKTSGGAGDAVGYLDDRPVTYGDVGSYLRTKDPEAFARSLEGLVLERVTRSEAEPNGVAVPDAEVARATQTRMRAWEERVRAAGRASGGATIEPALWLRRVAGVGMEEFRGWIRRHTEVELLQDRLLRFEQERSSRVRVSLLVVGDAGQAEALARRARGGEDFAALAGAHSVHATRQSRGALPFPLLPSDVNDASVREALFAAQPGDVVGPFPVDAGNEPFFQVYRVDRRSDPTEGGWPQLRERVEASLRARPVDVGEYERWRRRVLLRHGFVAASRSR